MLLYLNARDADPRERLAMALGSPVILPPLLLEYRDGTRAALPQYLSRDDGAGYQGLSDLHAVVAVDKPYPFQLHGTPDFAG
jgi:hypothetical protein